MKHAIVIGIYLLLLARGNAALAGASPQQLLQATQTPSSGPPPRGLGSIPYYGVVQGSDGCFYGTSRNGGKFGNGTIYKVSINGNKTTLTVLYSFRSDVMPMGRMIFGTDGFLYGTLGPYSKDGSGSIYRISTSGHFTELHIFRKSSHDGRPVGGLAQGIDGSLYGTATSESGGGGSVYKISATGEFTTIYKFKSQYGTYYLDGSLVSGNDGSFYGSTGTGRINESIPGRIYKITPDGVLTNLDVFKGSNICTPSSLVQASDGFLYGTTCDNMSGGGSVFKISHAGSLTTLHAFQRGTDDCPMNTRLVVGSDGSLYGTCAQGTIYKITPGGVFSPLCKITGKVPGSFGAPYGPFLSGLFMGKDGDFYGTAAFGCKFGQGCLFKVTPTGSVTILFNFGGEFFFSA